MLITAVKTQKRFRHRLERQYALYLKEKHKADWLQNRRSGHISLPLQFKPTGTVYCTRQTTRTRPYIDTGRTVSRRTQEKTESRFLVRDKIPPTRSTGLSLNGYYPSLEISTRGIATAAGRPSLPLPGARPNISPPYSWSHNWLFLFYFTITTTRALFSPDDLFALIEGFWRLGGF
jgi:hypothetical protein